LWLDGNKLYVPFARDVRQIEGKLVFDVARTLIRNLNIVDVVTGGELTNISLLISNDGIISYIGRIDKIDGVQTVDAQGGWAIPSYIDMHAHTTFEGRGHRLTAFHFDESENISVSRGSQNLTEALRSGVCLIRDMGAKGKRAILLKELVDATIILGPDLILSGEPLCVEGGHGLEFGQTLANRNVDVLLKNHLAAGYKWLKIMNGPELFNDEQLAYIVGAAHSLGIKVAVHAFTKQGIRGAVNAGADTVEHAVIFDADLVVAARESGTQFVPTYYSAWVSLRDEYISTVTHDLTFIGYLKQWYQFLERYFPYHIANGFSVLTGTDAGSAPSIPSDITNEIRILHHCGLSTLEAIRSATILPAQALACEDRYGSISVGKWANFIILEGNPTKDITSLGKIKAIWYKGINVFNGIETPWN